MVRLVKHEMSIPIPAEITFFGCKSRKVVVKGPRGTLKRDFSHLPLNLARVGNTVRVQCFFGTRKARASVRTLISHIQNMFTGVIKGYRYKMRLVYAHFPISINIEDNGKVVELRNFLGEKIVRRVTARADTLFINSTTEKETLYVEGNDIEEVSQSAANVQQVCKVKNKDIRKFLDGCYVSAKENIVQDAEE